MTKTNQLNALKDALKSIHRVMHHMRFDIFGPVGTAFVTTLGALHHLKHRSHAEVGDAWAKAMFCLSPDKFAAWVDKEFSEK